MPSKAWKDILWRTWGEISDDRITLIAAGATYYLLLALFPTVVAFVSLYGLFTDASTVNQHVALLSGIVPAGGMRIIDEQLTRLTQQGPATLGWGLVISLALALWTRMCGTMRASAVLAPAAMTLWRCTLRSSRLPSLQMPSRTARVVGRLCSTSLLAPGARSLPRPAAADAAISSNMTRCIATPSFGAGSSTRANRHASRAMT